MLNQQGAPEPMAQEQAHMRPTQETAEPPPGYPPTDAPYYAHQFGHGTPYGYPSPPTGPQYSVATPDPGKMKVKKNKVKGNLDPNWNGYSVGYPPSYFGVHPQGMPHPQPPPYFGTHPQGMPHPQWPPYFGAHPHMPHPQWPPYGAPWHGPVPPGYVHPNPARPATPMPPPAAETGDTDGKDFIGEFLKSPIPSLTSMLGMNDGEFWKGALLGAAAMMLLSGHLGNHEE